MGGDRDRVSGWPDLLELAERELALLRDGDADALPAAMDARARLAAVLGPAPAAARPVLEHLAAVQDQIITELTLARDDIARELVALRRGRTAMHGYRTAAGPVGADGVTA
jgi:hypothetical protein